MLRSVHRCERSHSPGNTRCSSGRRELLEPTAFTTRKPQTGDTVAIAYDRGRERVLIVQSLGQHLAIPAIGAIMVIVQIVSWTS